MNGGNNRRSVRAVLAEARSSPRQNGVINRPEQEVGEAQHACPFIHHQHGFQMDDVETAARDCSRLDGFNLDNQFEGGGPYAFVASSGRR